MKGIFFIAVFFTHSLVFSQVTNGLISSYSFTGNANDQLNNNNGSVFGAMLTNDRFGNANSAYQFDGFSGNYIDLGNSVSLKPSQITISLWAYIDSAACYQTALNYQPFIMAGNNNFPNAWYEGYGMGFWIPSPKLLAMSYQSGLSSGPVAFSLDTIQTKKWYHHVLSYNNDSLWMYINNKLIVTLAKNFTTTYNNNVVLLGKTNNASKEAYLNGKLDDIKIYNRVLNSLEIDTLYNEINGGSPNSTENFSHTTTNISLFPNPSHSEIQILGVENNSQIEVLNTLGEILINKKLDNNYNKIDISNLPTNLYFVKINSGNKFYFQHFIKN